MKQIPKYSKELIEQLALEILSPELPKSPKGWTGLIDDLLLALEEDNEVDGDSHGRDESSVGDGTWPYQTVAPSRVAGGYSEDLDDTILRPDEFGNY